MFGLRRTSFFFDCFVFLSKAFSGLLMYNFILSADFIQLVKEDGVISIKMFFVL